MCIVTCQEVSRNLWSSLPRTVYSTVFLAITCTLAAAVLYVSPQDTALHFPTHSTPTGRISASSAEWQFPLRSRIVGQSLDLLTSKLLCYCALYHLVCAYQIIF